MSRGSIFPISATTALRSRDARLQHLHPTKGQQLPGHGNGATGCLLNLLDCYADEPRFASVRSSSRSPWPRIIVSQIVEVVGDAAGRACPRLPSCEPGVAAPPAVSARPASSSGWCASDRKRPSLRPLSSPPPLFKRITKISLLQALAHRRLD